MRKVGASSVRRNPDRRELERGLLFSGFIGSLRPMDSRLPQTSFKHMFKKGRSLHMLVHNMPRSVPWCPWSTTCGPMPICATWQHLSWNVVTNGYAFHPLSKWPKSPILWGKLYDRSPHLYYATISANPSMLLPAVYTPTVGEACQKFGKMPLYPASILWW